MTKIIRNLSTKEAQSFWESAEVVAAQVEEWPASRRAGINVAAVRASSPPEPNKDTDPLK